MCTLGEGGSHVRFPTGFGGKTHSYSATDRELGRYARRLHYDHRRAMWKSALPLPQKGRSRTRAVPASNAQEPRQDRYGNICDPGGPAEGSARGGGVPSFPRTQPRSAGGQSKDLPVRPVEETLTPQEKKRCSRSTRRSRGK